MTLNISILTRDRVYVSADCRLAAFSQASDGQWVPTVDNSPKLVQLTYNKWHACITYCGVGMWHYVPTYAMISKWLTQDSSASLTFDEAAQALVAHGSRWINSISATLRRFQPHTFVFVGFDEAGARMCLLSNTQTINESLPKRQGSGLTQSWLRGGDSHVIVTGIANAVSRSDRALLKRSVLEASDPNVVRHRLAQANARAARTREANNGISTSCLCYSLDRLGSSAGELHGAVQGAFAPVHIQNGIDLSSILAGKMGVGQNAQMVGMTMTSSVASDQENRQDVTCTIRGEPKAASAQVHAGFQIREIGDITQFVLNPRALNHHYSNVGTIRYPISSSPQAYVWPNQGSIRCLGTLGGNTSSAHAINRRGFVVGTAARGDGFGRAFTWHESHGEMRDLGSLGGDYATANAINDEGCVVGGANVIPGQTGQVGERAFLWTQDTGMLPVPGVQDSWSFARGISNRGEVVGWYRHRGQPFSFVWSERDGLQIIEGVAGRGFYAVGISETGKVIGEGDDAQGVRRAMIWSRSTGLQVLDLPAGVHLTGIDEDGNMVAREHAMPWIRPWYIDSTLTASRIEMAEDHHSEPLAIANGVIVGVARKEGTRHIHAIAWTSPTNSAFAPRSDAQ